MTRSEFEELQFRAASCGTILKDFLREEGWHIPLTITGIKKSSVKQSLWWRESTRIRHRGIESKLDIGGDFIVRFLFVTLRGEGKRLLGLLRAVARLFAGGCSTITGGGFLSHGFYRYETYTLFSDMKHILSFLVVVLAAMGVVAQQKADVEVSYSEVSFFANGRERNHKYHLLANTGLSKFFNPRSEEIDSMSSTPEGLANFKKTQEAAMQAMIAQGAIDVSKLPRKVESVYVLKSSADSVMTVYDVLDADEPVYYTEPYSEMTWEIGDSTRTILGYECVQADTDYHGRHWTAWFTPEIPIQDGPWKFHGLPGLILEVKAEGGRYGYVADGIEKSDKAITGVYGAGQYEKRDRKAILRAKRARRDNPVGHFKAKGIDVEVSPENLSESSAADDFIETDYK